MQFSHAAMRHSHAASWLISIHDSILHETTGPGGENKDSREDAGDERLALAVYFDQEMDLLCHLPAAARALRRQLVADVAKVLRFSPFISTDFPIPLFVLWNSILNLLVKPASRTAGEKLALFVRAVRACV